MFVNRQRVLDRIRRRGAPITALVAPAGFGKTYIAQRIARVESRWAEIHCADYTGGPFVERCSVALGLHDAVRDDENAPRLIAAAWASLPEPLTLIVEELEYLDADPQARAIVAALIAEHPAEGKLILCARRDPSGLFSDATAPHMITVVRNEQLAFDDAEMHDLFAGMNVSETLLYRIARFTEGWPAPALYCARIAREGDLESVFNALDPTAFGELFDYLENQVLLSLPTQLFRALCAGVGLDDLRVDDFDRLFGDGSSVQITAELTRHFQVASLQARRQVEVSPVLRAVIRERYPADVRTTQLALARHCEETRDIARAAQCYLEAGEIAKASELVRKTESVALDALCIFSRMPQIADRTVLSVYPEVWAALIGARRLSEHPEVLIHEAATVLSSLGPEASDVLVNTVVAHSAIALMDGGRIPDGRAMLARGRGVPDDGPQDTGQLHLLAARATIDAAEGRYDNALAAWRKMQRHVLAHRTWFSQLTQIEITAARARGQWEVEYQLIERMLTAAREGGAPAIIGMALAEGVFGAWLAQEDDLVEAYRTQLSQLLLHHDLPGLLNFNLAALGRRPTPSRGASYDWDARAYLIAGAAADDPSFAADAVQTALAHADQAGTAFLRVLTRVAVAEKMPSTRARRLREALDIATSIDSGTLRESLAHLTAGEPKGMLSQFVNRLRSRSSSFETNTEPVRVRIALADATVYRDGSELNVSEGGWALLAALAIEPRSVARDMLCDRLWPDMPLESAHNALKMCVRRTRQQLGDAEAIVSTKGGYALGTHVEVDLREIERLRSAIAKQGPMEGGLSGIDALFERLTHGRPESFANWPWFEPTERRLQTVTSELGELLARDALEHEDHLRALRIAEYLITLDPFDEAARKLAISAHLAAKHRGAAILEYRQYQKVLKEELEVEPSAELRELLQADDEDSPPAKRSNR